jgi:hypothetical protein
MFVGSIESTEDQIDIIYTLAWINDIMKNTWQRS